MQPRSQTAVPWHVLPREKIEEQLKTGPDGLTSDEARSRAADYGPNELAAGHRVSALAILLSQFKNVLLVILIIATVVSALMGHGTEAIVIGVIVLFAVGLGFFQEYRAERAMEALSEMAAPMATLVRGGQEVQLPARELVPGDVVLLKAGDKVPADCRLIEAVNLQAEEAVLTGESVPSEKQTEPLADENLPVGDRKNIAFAGTAVTYGRGRGIVVATGMDTEFGKIAGLLQTVEISRTPLQKNLDRVGRALAGVAIVIVLVIVGIGLGRGEQFTSMLIFGIALAVAVVPEALPAVVTVSLALGVQRLAKRNSLVRRLPAVETLGSTSVICSDKTGTLTRDEMTVRRIWTDGQELDVSGAGYEPRGDFKNNGAVQQPDGVASELLRAGVLSSDAYLLHDESEKRWRVQGDPTEGALVAVAGKAGLEKAKLDAEFPRVGEIPFSSETKRMTTLHQTSNGSVAYCKGAPEMLLGSCTRLRTASGDVTLDEARKKAIQDAAQRMAESALRVLALAAKYGVALEDAQHDLTLLGLVGMIDPPRDEAKAAVEKCQTAGIKVVMITGDHPLTARAIARELAIAKEGRVVTGAELDALSDEALEGDVQQIEVYARVSPAHKLRVVTALQHRGHVVAMTGDGVNDAPALRKADIGIAMGIAGTDVTKEAAAMTLTDDNFASIVAAVEEGRGIFGNIKKYLMYLLSANLGEIGLMAGASLAGLPLPLSAVQILYVNLATDGLPALALAMDPPDDDIMRRPPRDPRRGIFTPSVVRLMAVGGAWSAAANLALFVGARQLGYSDPDAMTMTFVSLVLMEFFKAYAYRSDRQHVLHRPLVNRWLNLAIAWEIALLVAILYVPFLQRAFGVTGLELAEWAVIIFWAHTILPVLEFAKGLERRGIFGAAEES
ncbi:MAG: cation-translocating P-type ATPase [Planctomycetaceae bacterium]|nr:cation-translocating P-type ATPase [Planctomycetaceae bacterium]